VRAGIVSTSPSGLDRNLSWTGCIAQLVEQLTLNQRVAGSSPAAPTKKIKKIRGNKIRQIEAFKLAGPIEDPLDRISARPAGKTR
jgi:hypothetical protein